MARKSLVRNIRSAIAFAAIAALTMTSITPVAQANYLADPQGSIEAAATTNLRNVMYYGDWSVWDGEGKFIPKDMPVENLTHLNLAFMDFTKDGELTFCDEGANIGHPLGNPVTYGDINGGIVNEFQVLRQKNPNLKIGTSLGGWSKSSNFTWVARNPEVRAKFIKNVLAFMEYANLDFVDFDWEYPGEKRLPDKVDNKNDTGNEYSIPEDKDNYLTMVKEFRVALDAQEKRLGKEYEMSAALPMAHAKTELGINVAEMFKILDFGNIMTYDAQGAWADRSGHQTGLYDNPNDVFAGKGFSVDSSVKKYLELGAPSEKVVVGAAFYTRGWEKVSNDVPDPKLPGLFGKATLVNKDANDALSYGASNFAPIKMGDGGRNGGVWGWRNQADLKVKYPGLTEYWDDTAKAPYLYSATSGAFFTYDNPRSIAEKAKYVKANKLGGMISWMASQDKQTTSSKRDELTNAIKTGLFGSALLPTYKIVDPVVHAKATVSATKPEWGTGGGLNVTINNECKIETAGRTLQLTEEASKTLKHIKIYIKTNGVKVTGGSSPVPAVKEENGYYVFEFNGSEQKLIKPGKSLELKFTLDKLLDGLDGIESIEMTQKMYEGAPEFSRVTLYKAPPVVYADEDVNQDKKIDKADLDLVASKYNLKTGQANFDAKCDVTKNGVIDLFDIVRVSSKLPSPDDKPVLVDNWDATHGYGMGDIVIYGGKKYQSLGWWVVGTVPGTNSGVWKPIV